MNELALAPSPKRKVAIRSIICAAPENVLLELDLSAAESHVVARLCNDLTMIEQLTSGDLHSHTAQFIYRNAEIDKSDKWKIERYIGKKTNHGCGYRMQPPMMTSSINKEGAIVVSLAQVTLWHERWHTLYNVKFWWNNIEEKLRRDGYLITAYGKKRRFWDFNTNRESCLRAATAFEPQSVVSYHMDGATHPDLPDAKGGILEIKRCIADTDSRIKLINTAHDSLLLEVPRERSSEIAIHAKSLLERPLIVNGHTFVIPVDCERYDRRWKEDGEELGRDGVFRSKAKKV